MAAARFWPPLINKALGAVRAAMKPSIAFTWLGLAAAMLAAPASQAMAAAKPLALGEPEKALVLRLENYLNGIKSLQSRFLQFSSTGELSQGALYLLRPGKMRIVYDPPAMLEIVADGSWLIYNDKEMRQADHYPLGSTPASILVQENISLASGEIAITGLEKKAGVIDLTLTNAKDPEGELTLIFSESPLALKKWIVTDVQGIKTTVALTETFFGAALDPNLFKFVDPYAADIKN